MADFVESDDRKFAEQLTSFGGGLVTYGPLLGFAAGDITDAQDDGKLFTYILDRQGDVQAYSQTFTGYKNLARHGNEAEVLGAVPVLAAFPAAPVLTAANIEARFRQRAAQAKSSSAYTKAIGETLRIEAPVEDFDPLLGKPTFKIFSDSGHPLLKWVKGKFQGVEIWVNYGQGWVKLERDLSSPFIDRAALPATGQSAVWKYKMIYILKDETIGLWSDEASVTVYGAV